MITLRVVVNRYKELATGAGEPVALGAFGLSHEETVKVFSGLDEDYHISRHLHFSREEGPSYRISGEEVTHVAIDAAVSSLL